MIAVTVEIAQLKRPLSNGAVRAIIHAKDVHAETGDEQPAAVFLCSIEPPNSFERIMRESFITVCSVEDMVEYPVGVSSITEVNPAEHEEGMFLYSSHENKVYIRGEKEGVPVWLPYQPEGKQPNVHTHKLPFFRRSVIDVIFPHRDFVIQSLDWIRDAVRRLEKDQRDLEQLRPYTQ
jgi:hypothetical protein